MSDEVCAFFGRKLVTNVNYNEIIGLNIVHCLYSVLNIVLNVQFSLNAHFHFFQIP